jgi:hypothetical protein
MKRFSNFVVILVTAVAVSACGGQPAAPTLSAVDVQATAVAAAFTMIAETEAAIPTATPLPPTETATQTPLPTDTPPPLPTLNATLTSPTAPVAANTSTGGDPCATRVLAPKKGRATVIRVVNDSKATVRVSMYLQETAAHGECGYRSFDLTKNNDIVFTDLVQGCYWLWAWNIDNKEQINSSGSGCINNPDKWTFTISSNHVKFDGP